MSKKRNNKESMIHITPKPSKKNFRNDWGFFVNCIQSKEKFFTEKELFKQKGE